MSYSPDRACLWWRGAIYVDKILRGIDPAGQYSCRPNSILLSISGRRN